MSLLTDERRIAELLLRATRQMSLGASVAEAAAFIGVPTETLREWRAQLARAEARQARRRRRRIAPAFPPFNPDL